MASSSPRKSKKVNKLSALEQRISDLKALLPSQQDWRTSDEQEIARRQVRALENPPVIRNLNPAEKIHSTFVVVSQDTQTAYQIEIIDLKERFFYSTTPDFLCNGLNTCKHTEAVLFHLEKRFPGLFKKALQAGNCDPTLIVKNGDLYIHGMSGSGVPRKLRLCINADGTRKEKVAPAKLIRAAEECIEVGVRISQEIYHWLEEKHRKVERKELEREYQQKVHLGEYPSHETLLPLYPYQREGMLHLAFKERAMVADEMGLGKTIQGIAAASLLHRLGKAQRCLIVAPASLKAEWEEQIKKFTTLSCEVVYGSRSQRVHVYQNPAAFFTIVNYEQVRSDSLDINAALKPDIVILDEAQRIKNWASLTAQAIKRLNSRYAFVLTGTPIENRIDELYSIVEFLDPRIFGSLFRFNRDFYLLDEDRGKPEGYKNLDVLREKVSAVLLRRLKSDVETELPDRVDENRFVMLTEGQVADYSGYVDIVAQLGNIAKKRALRREEHQRLMGALGCMRMLCDTQFILDKETRESPKLDELIPILDQALTERETKIIIFSEWVGMLTLIRDHLKGQKVGYAWHTGSVPQKKRRQEIRAFKEDPDCRILLCTESGGSGLNLQNASVVINMDLPWNPAKLEQRIARAWRKGQTKQVQVINIIAQGTIEHGMLETLAIKQGLADGVLDGKGNLSEIKLKKGGASFLARLEQTLAIGEKLASTSTKRVSSPPVDPAQTLAQRLQDELGESIVFCEEHFTEGGISKVYLVVDKHSAAITKCVLKACDQAYPQHKNSPNWMEENIMVIDKTTHESFLQLQRAGLMQTNTRARRNLLSPGITTASKPSLTPEEQAKVDVLTEVKSQQTQAANLLIQAGLHALAIPHVKETLLSSIQAEAIRNFTTPAETLDDLIEEPHKTLIPSQIHPLLDRMDFLTEAEQLMVIQHLWQDCS